jgi:hypothetical protein
MAKTNFQYEKRQRELEKKRKAEEKARRKMESKQQPAAREGVGSLEEDGTATAPEPETQNPA